MTLKFIWTWDYLLQICSSINLQYNKTWLIVSEVPRKRNISNVIPEWPWLTKLKGWLKITLIFLISVKWWFAIIYTFISLCIYSTQFFSIVRSRMGKLMVEWRLEIPTHNWLIVSLSLEIQEWGRKLCYLQIILSVFIGLSPICYCELRME